MSNLFPQSLAGRLVFWLLVCLLAVQTGLAVVQGRQKHKLEVQLQESSLHTKAIGMARALDTADPEHWHEVIAKLHSPDIKVEVDPERLFKVPDDAATVWVTKTEQGDVRTIQVRRVSKQVDKTGKSPPDKKHEQVHEFTFSMDTDISDASPKSGHSSHKPAATPTPKSRQMMQFIHDTGGISVPLDDGQWLNASFGGVPTGPGWRDHLPALITATLMALVVIVVVQLETRSMKTLALAADRLGRGEDLDPLPETGPKETRTALMAFNRMGERLGRFVRDRTRMLAAMSHDLRTPLTSMRLQVEEVEDAELRQRLIASIEEMRQMADASLEFASADARKEKLETTDLSALTRQVVQDFADIGEIIDFEADAPVQVTLRPMAMRRAVRNLVENALRYGADVQIATGTEQGKAFLEVLDRGPGIPDADIERVFEPFTRLETSRNRETGGVGMGLAIARTIVRSSGGDIALANRKDGGLRARIVLPLD